MSEFRFPPIKFCDSVPTGKVRQSCNCEGSAREHSPVVPRNISNQGFEPLSAETEVNSGVYLGILGKKNWVDPKTNKNLVVAKDDRLKKTVTSSPYNMIVKITNKATGGIIGTGAMIGPKHILTAAHVVYDHVQGTAVPKANIQLTRWGQASTVTPSKVLISEDFKLNSPYVTPTDFVEFARFDYALLVTASNLLPAATTFFGYDFPSDKNWLATQTISTLGFPSKTAPCTSVAVYEPQFFTGPFGRCAGNLYGQSGKTISTAWDSQIQIGLDMTFGQSGSPLYTTSGSTRIIRGILSYIDAKFGNFAHRIRSGSKAAIEAWVDANP